MSSCGGAREVASGQLSFDGSGVEAGVGGATPSTGAASGFDVDFFPPISRANRSHASTVMSSAAVFATNARVAASSAFAAWVKATALRIEMRSEEHTSELQSLMRISYAVFCLKKQTNK